MPTSTLRKVVAHLQEQLSGAEAQTTTSAKFPNATPARGYIASEATQDQRSEFADPFSRIGSGRFRPTWVTQPAAVQQTKVITTNIQPPANAVGSANAPATTSATPGGVPDMVVALRVGANSQVHIAWSFSGSLSATTLTATFALYRDGQRIGQPVYGMSPQVNGKFSVSQSFIDSPQAGLHSYAVYWSTSGGTLTADAKSRQITALNLKPQ